MTTAPEQLYEADVDCQYCRRIYGNKPGFPFPGAVSTGICPECNALVLAGIQPEIVPNPAVRVA